MEQKMVMRKRSPIMVELERLLQLWIEEMQRRRVPITLALVREKARSLFQDLKAAEIEKEGTCDEEFTASKGWFHRTKARVSPIAVFW